MNLKLIPKINGMPVIVPSKVCLPKQVTGDYPIGQNTYALAGEYIAFCNDYGAVSVSARGGMLGIKPDEFEVLEFVVNPSIETQIAKRKWYKFWDEDWEYITLHPVHREDFPDWLDREEECGAG